MTDIGNNRGAVLALLKEFENFEASVANIEVHVSHVCETARRLRMNGQTKGAVRLLLSFLFQIKYSYRLFKKIQFPGGQFRSSLGRQVAPSAGAH